MIAGFRSRSARSAFAHPTAMRHDGAAAHHFIHAAVDVAAGNALRLGDEREILDDLHFGVKGRTAGKGCQRGGGAQRAWGSGDGDWAGVSIYYFLLTKLLFFFWLQGEVEIGRRRLRVLFTIAASRMAVSGQGRVVRLTKRIQTTNEFVVFG